MVKAIRVHQAGEPEIMIWKEVVAPDPGLSEVRIVNTAIGVKFVDSYMRRGLGPFGDGEGCFPMDYPAVLGFEGADVVDAVGGGVDEISPGDRVTYTGLPLLSSGTWRECFDPCGFGWVRPNSQSVGKATRCLHHRHGEFRQKGGACARS